MQPAFQTVQGADVPPAQPLLTHTFAFHVLLTCTFLSAVTPRQYFLTRFLMQIFCSISDVYIKGEGNSSEVVPAAPAAVLTDTQCKLVLTSSYDSI